MASLQNIRYGLAARLATITPAISYSHTVPKGPLVTPFAFVALPMGQNVQAVRFDESFGNGTACWNLQVYLLLSKTDVEAAQDLLDPYISNDAGNTQSMFQAIMGDIHLTYNSQPTASSTRVKGAHSYGQHKVGSTDFLGVIFEVEVISSP